MVTNEQQYEQGRRLIDGGNSEERPYAATVGAALARATRELASAGVSEPRLDAEILLAYVLAWERSREDLNFRLHLRDHRLEAVREMRLFILATFCFLLFQSVSLLFRIIEF